MELHIVGCIINEGSGNRVLELVIRVPELAYVA